MGMSADFPAAIAAGATHRSGVGTAIFGLRTARHLSLSGCLRVNRELHMSDDTIAFIGAGNMARSLIQRAAERRHRRRRP